MIEAMQPSRSSAPVPQSGPTIAVLSTLVGGFYFGDIVAAIDVVAREHGAQVLAVQTTRSWWSGAIAPTVHVPIGAAHVDGYLIVADALHADNFHTVTTGAKPVVTISAGNPASCYPSVMPDNRGGAAAAVRHLLDHGHRRIGFVGWLGQEDPRQRYEGYCSALAERGIAPDPALLFAAVDDLESGGRLAADALLAAGMPCTALVVATDQNAIGLMEAVQATGYRVPQDLAIIGFDDIDLAQQCVPPLTTIRQNFGALGTAAAECLLRILEGAPVSAGTILVPTMLICRRSCGCTDDRAPVTLAQAQCTTDWSEMAARRLVQRLIWPLRLDETTALERAWPELGTIVDALEAAVAGTSAPRIEGVDAAWRLECIRTSSPEILLSILTELELLGTERLHVSEPGSTEGRARLDAFLTDARLSVLRSAAFGGVRARRAQEIAMKRGHRVSLALSYSDGGSAAGLEWAGGTGLRDCCLALWEEEPLAEHRLLVVRGSFVDDGVPCPIIGVRSDLQSFPPPEFLNACTDQEGGRETVLVMPVGTSEHDWGYIAAVTAADSRFYEAHDALRLWTAQLAGALEREALARVADEQRRRLRERELAEKESYRAAAARLEELNRQLAETDRLKTDLLEQTQIQAAAATGLAQLRIDFVAAASHELRTPLTAIMGYAELLEAHWDRFDDARRLDQIHRIYSAAARQQRLVEELLAVSKLELGAVACDTSPVLLATLIERAADEVRTSYLGQDIELEGPRALSVMVDSDRTLQTLVNVVDNAAKYSPEGSPIAVYWQLVGAQAVIHVRDHGPGISVVGRERLFTRFGRVPGGTTRAGHIGTGLGLYLGRSFAQSMGGQLELESTGPAGSVFCLTLPAIAEADEE
jgi:DNA-binding LacI/PurR family transcriptional regulator/signal transduction histidine kinase